MNAYEWKDKLFKAIDDHWKLTNEYPNAIYMGYKEDIDYRANLSPGEYWFQGKVPTFEGVEIILVCKESYFRVI